MDNDETKTIMHGDLFAFDFDKYATNMRSRTEGLTEGVSQGLTEGVSQGLTEGVSQGLTEGVTDDASYRKEACPDMQKLLRLENRMMDHLELHDPRNAAKFLRKARLLVFVTTEKTGVALHNLLNELESMEEVYAAWRGELAW